MMNFSRFIYNSVSFILALFFILVGILNLFLAQSENWLKWLVQFISTNPWLSTLVGILFIAIGIGLLVRIRINSKKQYYEIKAGNHITCLDEKIFEKYLDTYWKELFPKNQVLSSVALRKNQLYITADLPYIPLEEQKTLLQQIENDLNDILIKYLGYHQEYLISINFQPETLPSK